MSSLKSCQSSMKDWWQKIVFYHERSLTHRKEIPGGGGLLRIWLKTRRSSWFERLPYCGWFLQDFPAPTGCNPPASCLLRLWAQATISDFWRSNLVYTKTLDPYCSIVELLEQQTFERCWSAQPRYCQSNVFIWAKFNFLTVWKFSVPARARKHPAWQRPF